MKSATSADRTNEELKIKSGIPIPSISNRTYGKSALIRKEIGSQRYCCHQFTGGSCVMCHYNPWRELGAAFDAVAARRKFHEWRKP